MAIPNRERDFTAETLNMIESNFKTEKEPYRELSTWWNQDGGVFDTIDPTPEIQYLESYMSELREFMAVTAPNALKTITDSVSDAEATYVTQVTALKNEVTDYGKAVDTLIEIISDKDFATNFDKTKLIEKVFAAAPILSAIKEEKDAFIANAKEQYGFDEETAKIMWKVWQGIKEANPTATPRELSYIYTRAISQLWYNKGNIQDEQWRAGAGYIYGYTDEEKWEYFKTLGLNEEEYKLLNYNVRVQSVIVGDISKNSPAGIQKMFQEKDTDKDRNYYNRKEQMEKGLGKVLTDDEFKKIWKQYYDRYTMKDPISNKVVARTDFAHQMYTIAGALAPSDAEGIKKKFPPWIITWRTGGRYWTDEESRKQYIGWLGDATYLGIDNDGISFGSDDYASDLDADNIRRRMEKDGFKKDVTQISKEYYIDLEKNDKIRTQEFKHNNPYEDVEKKVLTAAGVKNVEDLKSKQGWSDSYDFLISLKNDDFIVQDHSSR